MTTTLPFPDVWKNRYLASDPEIAEWYACRPHQLAGHARSRLKQLPAPLSAPELREWEDWLALHDAPEGILANAAVLAKEGSLCVVTGQQAGLFGGPLMTLYKAAAAAIAARAVEHETGHRCIPVFWVASDDHDFAEVASHNWMSSAGDARSWTASPEPGQSGAPVSSRPLEAELLEAFLKDFEQGEPDTDFRTRLRQALRAIARHPGGATWESQFVRSLLTWLAPLGIVPFAPRLGFARRRARSLIQMEIEQPALTSRLLRDSASLLHGLGASGHTLHRKGGEANVFLDVEGVRSKITWQGDATALATHPVSGAELARLPAGELLAVLDRSPGRFSPNAALRPVVQDAILPTVASVLGPSELLYHAQIRDLYGHFGVFRPCLLPRPSAVLVDRRTGRLMEKLRVGIDDLLHGGPTALKAAAAHAGDESDLRGRTTAKLAAVSASLAELHGLLDSETRDTGLLRAAEKMAESLNAGEAKLHERLEQFLLRRAETASGQAGRIAQALWPNGSPQERWLGWLAPLVAQYGPEAPAWVARQMTLDASHIHVIHPGAMNAG